MSGLAKVMNDRQHPADSLDYFPTPPWATRALLHEVLPRREDGVSFSELRALDPCAGGGHMLLPLSEVFGAVDFSDVHDWGIDPPIRDFTFETVETLLADGRVQPDWVFCNPPFNIATAFFDRARAIARMGVAFFVRSSWLSGQERFELIYRLTPPTFVVHFAERVALIEGAWDPHASSATDYVWLVWIAGMAPRPPIWLRPGMQAKYTRAVDMELATPGEAKRRAARRKANP
ncbi:SAM-dependent DNA methyltransferase [Hoeflea sp. BAL378]|uniref:SAM-dependent DNA methyltransferase n=1 Tax=Hoeflea sp. BAL378 TaxID=1547437 RepID=UPI001269A784|nr:SAM-dependent DNA methyltransferase [Hoeflea sp. BAL378]